MRPSRLGLQRGSRFSHFLFVMPELYSALGLLCFVLTLCSGLGTHLLMALPKVNDNLIRWKGTLLVYECPSLLMALPKVEGPYRQCREVFHYYIYSELLVGGTFRRFAYLPGVLGICITPLVLIMYSYDL